MLEDEKDENFVFLWFKITNESIPLIKWDGLKSIFIIGILSLIIVLNVWFKGLIINYIVRFAPKDRPINEMMLLEQVSLFTFKAAVCLQNNLISGPNSDCLHNIFINVCDFIDVWPTLGYNFWSE